MEHFYQTLETYGRYELKTEVPAALLTTFEIGGLVRLVVYPKTTADIVQAVRLCTAANIPYRIIGRGSNILASDEDYEGVWLITTACNQIDICENHVEVTAGVLLDDLVTHLIEAELVGLENLAGIPGTVGGAIVMNAGAFGTQFSDMIVAVNVFNTKKNQVYCIPYESCGFSYRRSIFQRASEYIILGASLRLGYGRADIIEARAESVKKQRRETQPYDKPSAGSVFRRPRGHFAGKLISEAGFSGYRVGGAAVSEKHNGFIVNMGGATCSDVKTIISQIRKRIFETTGVLLQTEIISV